MLLSPALILPNLVADPALPMSSRSAIGVFLSVFVSAIAMCFSKVWTHGQPLVEDVLFRVNNFCESIKFVCSIEDGVRFKTAHFRKNRGLVFDALNGHDPRNTGVEHLVFPRCPSAILGAVIPVRVDSFKREFIGTLPHVLHEGREAGNPPFADSNPPAP